MQKTFCPPVIVNKRITITDPLHTNLHTHTTFCDGKNTPEEMVRAALEKGMTCIGFSGHSYVADDPTVGMRPEQEAAYRAEIARLREVYRDRITIYCGLELDYETELKDRSPYDYFIGSVHYFRTSAGIAAVDASPQVFEEAVRNGFGNDFYRAAGAYFELVSDVVRKTDCDIIGHFDLITKFNEQGHFFDEEDPRYVAAWQHAVDKLIPEGRIFEINTGAVARGLRTRAYPSLSILKYIRERGGRFLLSSDSHDTGSLGCQFEAYAGFLEGNPCP